MMTTSASECSIKVSTNPIPSAPAPITRKSVSMSTSVNRTVSVDPHRQGDSMSSRIPSLQLPINEK
jgi:hypothetical protein